MTKVSEAAAVVCEFVCNIIEFYDVVCDIEPKRQLLAKSEAELSEATTELAAVELLVGELNAKLAILMEQYDSALKTKNEAVAEAEKYSSKMSLATRLTNALGAEGERWSKSIITQEELLG
jgi:uncharacterized protein YsxB (DUF464 family)